MRNKVVVVEVNNQVHLIRRRNGGKFLDHLAGVLLLLLTNKKALLRVKNQVHLIRRRNGGKFLDHLAGVLQLHLTNKKALLFHLKKKKKVSPVTDLVSTEASFVRKLDVVNTSIELPDFSPESFFIENLAKNIVGQQVVQKK